MTKAAAAEARQDRVSDRLVLLVISGGLIVILLAIIVGLFLTPRALPNWAENVFVSIATATALKLGDALSTLVALSSGRNLASLGTQLGSTIPTNGAPLPVVVENKPSDPVPTDQQPSEPRPIDPPPPPPGQEELP